jgi:NTE family protein
MPQFTILQMIYQQAAYEGQAKDFEFSGTSMREHWDAGYRDTNRTLSRRTWLAMPGEDGGIAVHDVHRRED